MKAFVSQVIRSLRSCACSRSASPARPSAVSLILAMFLQVAPCAQRLLPASPALAAAPVAVFLRWVAGALAVAGSYHAVSAASAALGSATKVSSKVGSRLSYQIKISDGETRQPESWLIEGESFSNSGSTTTGMPPGLSLSLSTGIINGIPKQAGSFPVTITAYEHKQLSGAELTFTVTFEIAAGSAAPVISAQPVGGTVAEGGSFTFTVGVTGEGTLTYQWRHGNSILPGPSGPALTLDPVQLSDAGEYIVVVSSPGGSSLSQTATLVVTPRQNALKILAQPPDSTVHLGETLNLSVAAEGNGALTYRWQHDGEDINGQTGPGLVLTSVTARDAGAYTVLVTDAGGSLESTPATVTVVPLSLQITSVSADGTYLLLSTIPGREYSLEAAETITGSWQTLKQLTANEESTVFVDTAVAGRQRYWRVRLLAQ